jgi:MULE transposase domain/SWIM zinc finger
VTSKFKMSSSESSSSPNTPAIVPEIQPNLGLDVTGIATASMGDPDINRRNQRAPSQRTWLVETAVHPLHLDSEIEKFGPLTRTETKCDKTYYRCPFSKRFGCPMIIRTMREVQSGQILIESCGLEHSHEASNERFTRGLSQEVKERIEEITKFNLRIRPRALQRTLLSQPFNFTSEDVPLAKITSYLHRNRRAVESSYTEHTISGLWNAVNSRQFEENLNDWSRYFFTEPSDNAIVGAATGNAKVRLFATTRLLLQNVENIINTAGVFQIAIDSKYRVLMNNYPITAVGVLDAGQQFNLIALAVSNKEDEEFYTSFLKSIEAFLLTLGIPLNVSCTMSDSCDAIHNALHACFPTSRIGNCYFHIMQNIKKKRGVWNIAVPAGMSPAQKTKFVVQARKERERFAQESIRWLSTISCCAEFELAGKIFLEILHAQGDGSFSDSLKKEYFDGIKVGWARAFLPCGSAGTNNSLEAFNGNILSKDIAAGSRMTLIQLFAELDGMFKAQSESMKARRPPLTPVDVRPSVRAGVRMKARVKGWYEKALDIGAIIKESFFALHQPDGSGGFYLLSSASIKQKLDIHNVLQGRSEVAASVARAKAEAEDILIEWRGLPEELALKRLTDAFVSLQNELLKRDTSYYHVTLVEQAQNAGLQHAKRVAQNVSLDQAAEASERARATEALNSGMFLYYGATTHNCTCPGFQQYGACKHTIWATMETTGEKPPANVDPRALATRRRAGRPRSAGRALQILPNAQEPLI